MGWLITVFARLAFLAVWIWSPLVTRAFHGTPVAGWLLPLLGLLFLPITALVYVLVWVPGVGVTGWSWLWVALAVLIDLGTHSAGAYSSRRAANSRARKTGLPA